MSPKPAKHDGLRLGGKSTSCPIRLDPDAHLHSLHFAGQWNQSGRKPQGQSCKRVASRSEVLREQIPYNSINQKPSETIAVHRFLQHLHICSTFAAHLQHICSGCSRHFGILSPSGGRPFCPKTSAGARWTSLSKSRRATCDFTPGWRE